MATVIRRRAGTHEVRRSNDKTVHLLESGFGPRTMAERLAAGVEAMHTGLETGQTAVPTVGIEGREDQDTIIGKFAIYAEEMAEIAKNPTRPAIRARTIAAARTGKTIVMIRLIALMGLRCVILAPSTTIVDKTVAEIKQKLPHVPVGAYYGDAKDIVNNGVTVATYQITGAHAKRSILPASIREVALVFCDEGHETMTEHRQDALDAFDPQALVVAFTATPDYSKEKTLAVFYPYLIDEMRLMEAAQRGLLAPGRMRWKPLDVTASHVRLVTRKVEGELDRKDYDEVELGKVMSQAVVFEACRHMRYEETSEHPYLRDEAGKPVIIEHRKLKTLICAASTNMAQELYKWLRTQRPEGSGQIALVLGSTPSDVRRAIIAEFKAGTIDTLINVRVLLRGFDEPTMKLLIDLSPSISPVIAEQKFCRPLTKVGDEAGIVTVLYPHGLRPPPILPMAVLGPSFTGDDTREFFEDTRVNAIKKAARELKEDGQATEEIRRGKRPPNARRLKVKKLATLRELNVVLRPPSFDPESTREVREILWSSPEFMRSLRLGMKPSRVDFRQMLFNHDKFVGFGLTLLRFCKVGPGTQLLWSWLNKQVPEFDVIREDEEDPGNGTDEMGDLFGREVLMPDLSEFPDPDSLRDERTVELQRILDRFVRESSNLRGRLSPRESFVIERHLTGYTHEEIAEEIGCGRANAQKIWSDAVSTLRMVLKTHLI